jgi:hypothetical protein
MNLSCCDCFDPSDTLQLSDLSFFAFASSSIIFTFPFDPAIPFSFEPVFVFRLLLAPIFELS